MSDVLEARVLRTAAELKTVLDQWTSWHEHPNADPEFFSAIVGIRPQVLGPYAIALYRNGELETLLIGRLERAHVSLKIGYWNIAKIEVVSLVIVYGGVLGKLSPEHCQLVIRQLRESFRAEKCHMVSLHFAPVDSPLRAELNAVSTFRRDHFEEVRPHWVMKLPASVDEIYSRMSTKARKNRKYEARRLEKEFARVELRCYELEADLERVLNDAEEIARRTYQRGLGVGFRANDETRARMQLEMRRGRFRSYFLYVDEKPIAFFIGTLHKNVLHDNFSAYDPDYSRLSPGTYLFFQIFERACNEKISSIDFGFGDAWYKAQFGTEKKDEVTVNVFAPTPWAVGVNLIRTPVYVADLLGKAAVRRLSFLQSVKKRLRGQAQKRAAE